MSSPAESAVARVGIGLLASLFACVSDAGSLDELEFKHGIAFFDDLKYPVDFTHFEYLNPDAPKGGKLVLAHGYSFDTLAPAAQGETGAPSGYHYRGETLVVRGGDEVAAFYGRLADGIAVADDRADHRIQDPSRCQVG